MSSQSRNNRIKRLLMSSDTELTSESTTSSGSPKKYGPKKRKPNGDGKVFIVERILKYKQWKGVRYARVKWLGYHETTWEPANAIFDFTPDVATEMKPEGKKVAECLMGRRKIRGNVEYKVHWKGLPSIFDKWIRESTLKRPDLVEAFMKNSNDKSVKTLRLIPSAKQLQKRKASEEEKKSTTPRVNRDRGEEFGIPQALPVKSADDTPSPSPPPDEEDPSSEVTDFPAPLPSSTNSPLLVKISKQAVKSIENRELRSPSTASTTSSKLFPLSGYAELTDSKGNKYRFIDDKPMKEWSVYETYEYILQRGFPEVATVAQAKEVAGASLLEHLEPAALKEFLTIPLGPSLKLVKLLKNLKNTKPNMEAVQVEPSVECTSLDSEQSSGSPSVGLSS